MLQTPVFAQNPDIPPEEEISAGEQFSKSLGHAVNNRELSKETILAIIFSILILIALLAARKAYQSNKSRQKRLYLACEKINEQAGSVKLNSDDISFLADIAKISKLKDLSSIVKSPHIFENALELFYEKKKKPASNEAFSNVRNLRRALGFLPLPREIAFTSTRQFNDGDKCAVQIPDDGKPSHKGVCIIFNVGENEWSIDRPIGPPIPANASIRVDLTRPGDAKYSLKTQVIKDSGDELFLRHSNMLDRAQQRNWARVKVNIVATITEIESARAGEVFAGEIIDMSGGGFGIIALPSKLQNGSKLSISFDLPGYGLVNVAVKVVRLAGHFGNDPTKIVHGVAFEGDIGKVKEQILKYVNEKQRQEKITARGGKKF